MEIAEQKNFLRKQIREAEKALAQEYKDESSAKICANIMSLPEYRKAGVLLAFVSMSREADISAVLNDALSRGKTLCVPRCQDGGVMEFRQISGQEDLETGAYGLREPKKSCPVIPPEAVEFALIPCVTCDRSGRRLGNGGGYYDRFLENYRPPMAAVCREKLLADRVPVEAFDVSVPLIVTEAGIYKTASFDQRRSKE